MARQRDTIVYRIEDAEGGGPFRGGSVRKAHREAYGDTFRHDPREMPAPASTSEGHVHEHYCLGLTSDHLFGFATKAQMRRWFKPALLRRLAAKGFRLGVYRVPSNPDIVAVSAHQAVFRRSMSTLERTEILK